METTRVKCPENTVILKDNLIMNIYPMLRKSLFQGDLAVECELCDTGTGRTDYDTAVRYAVHHVSTVHSEVIVIQEGNEVTFL